MLPCRRNVFVQKWAGFAVGCLQMIAAGPFLAKGACALDMKEIYQMSQEQCKLLYSEFTFQTLIEMFGVVRLVYGH